MLRMVRLFSLSCLLAIGALAELPKAGDPAPQFSLPSSKGGSIALKDYMDKSKVVLVFYRGDW